MQDLTAKRTLVKSPPELWDELSEVERLARHLGVFGEIKITKLESERTVAWEGEHASGTVSIEPSGWGTKVILTAELAGADDPAEPGAGRREPVADGEHAAPDDGAMEPSPEEAVADLVHTDVTTREDDVPPPAEPAHAQAEHAEEVAVEPLDQVDAPAAETPPAAALAFDVAGAPASGTRRGAAGDPLPDRPRRRRGFWARLFAGWLVPEERLNRRAAKPFDHTVAPWVVEPPDETVEEAVVLLDETPAAEQPAGAPDVVADVIAVEQPGVGVEDVEPPGPEVEEEHEPPTTDAEPAKPLATDVEPVDPPASNAEPAAIDPDGARAVLEATLDALGSAHHRPYSRS